MAWIRWDEAVYSDAAVRDVGLNAFKDRDLGECYWGKFLMYVKRRGERGMASIVDVQSLIDAGVGGTVKRWTVFLAALPTSGLVTVTDATWTVRQWRAYQQDPTAAERQAKSRAKARGDPVDDPVTPCHSDVTVSRHTGRDGTGQDERSPPTPPGGKASDWDLACTAMTGDGLRTDAFREAWADWAADRRERRKKLTTRAIKLQIKELEAWGHDRAIVAIKHTIRKGWTGLVEPQATRRTEQTQRPSQGRPKPTAADRGEYDEGSKPIPFA